MLETEYKYLCDRGLTRKQVFNTLKQTFLKAGYNCSEPTTRSRIDTYLDTPNRSLSQLDWSLRVRQPKKRQPTLELKRLCGDSRLFRRKEIVQPWKEAKLSRSSGPVTTKLIHLVDSLDTISPLVELHIKRKSLLIADPNRSGSTVECDIDRVVTKHQHYLEVELELCEGDESLLRTLDGLVLKNRHFYPARLSKFQRSLHKTSDQEFAQPDCRPETWASLSHRVLKRDVSTLIEAEPRAWESIDEDGVHDLRVSTRRMRAHLHLFSQMYDQKQAHLAHQHLRTLGHSLGLVRDDDVHLTQVRGDNAAQRKYRRKVMQARARHSRALRQLLLDQFETAIQTIEEVLKEIPRISTDPWQALQQTLARIESYRIPNGFAPKQLHKLRKSIKIAIYQLQAMALADPDLADLCDSARRVQHLLGEFQDREMGIARLSKHGKKIAADLHRDLTHPSTFQEDLTNAWMQFLSQLRRAKEAQSC